MFGISLEEVLNKVKDRDLETFEKQRQDHMAKEKVWREKYLAQTPGAMNASQLLAKLASETEDKMLGRDLDALPRPPLKAEEKFDGKPVGKFPPPPKSPTK